MPIGLGRARTGCPETPCFHALVHASVVATQSNFQSRLSAKCVDLEIADHRNRTQAPDVAPLYRSKDTNQASVRGLPGWLVRRKSRHARHYRNATFPARLARRAG